MCQQVPDADPCPVTFRTHQPVLKLHQFLLVQFLGFRQFKHGIHQCIPEGRVFFFQHGDQVVTHPVPEILIGGIAGVFPEPDIMLSGVIHNGFPGGEKQGTDDLLRSDRNTG